MAVLSMPARRAWMAWVLALTFALAAGAPRASWAEPTTAELNKARAQFQQGLALETAGDWAGALALFQEVASVKMTPQVRFNIALCEEHLGRLALALGDYKLAQVEAEMAKVPAVLEQVPGRVEGLLARVPRLTVKRGNGADFATISLDGVALGAASLDKGMPVDPGPHTIEARAPGFNLFLSSFNIAERDAKTVEVTLARLSKAEPTERRPSSAVNASPPTPREPARAPASPSRSVLPFVIGGAGAALLVGSGVFALLRASAVSDMDRQCPQRDQCPASALGTYDKVKVYTTATDVTLIAGALGFGTGAVLYFVSSPSSPTKVGATVGAPGTRLGATLVAKF